jgi:hypothetical protein
MKSYHSDIEYHMTLNIKFSVVATSHGYILGANMNECTPFNNVM